jgi:hypothetical protein
MLIGFIGLLDKTLDCISHINDTHTLVASVMVFRMLMVTASNDRIFFSIRYGTVPITLLEELSSNAIH